MDAPEQLRGKGVEAAPMTQLHLHVHHHQQLAAPARAGAVGQTPIPADDDVFLEMCHTLLHSNPVDDGGASATKRQQRSSSSSASPVETSVRLEGPGSSCVQPSTQHTTTNTDVPSQTRAHKSSQVKKLEEGASSKRSQRQIRIKLMDAEKKLQELKETYGAAEVENNRLKSHSKNLSACLEQSEFQLRISEIVHYAPRNPFPLPSSCSQVSFSEIPPSSRWDASWISRIKQLKPQDFLVLRRQWTQLSAVLLPQALAYGPQSNAYKQLEELHNKQRDLGRAVVTLSPGVWLESSQYDMDTLSPTKAPTPEWVRDLFNRLVRPPAIRRVVALGTQYHSCCTALHVEYHRLLQRYNALAQAMNLQQLDLGLGAEAAAAGSSSAGAGPRFDPETRASNQSTLTLNRLRLDVPPRYLETVEQLDQVAGLLQENTNKHKVALLKYFSSFHDQFHPARIHFVLMSYPLASTVVDFIPGLLLLGEAAN